MELHPFCEWFIQRHKLDEEVVIRQGGTCTTSNGRFCVVPRATEIHHRRGRVGSLLTDLRYFLSVSHQGHVWIHNNPGEAYARGFMLFR